MFFRKKKSKNYEYLQIVEGFRDGGKVHQRVLLTLGKLQHLRENGNLDGLLRSGARFNEKLALLSAHNNGKSEPVCCNRIGPDKVFSRLWRELGIGNAIKKSIDGRRFQFEVERAVYHTVLHRLAIVLR